MRCLQPLSPLNHRYPNRIPKGHNPVGFSDRPGRKPPTCSDESLFLPVRTENPTGLGYLKPCKDALADSTNRAKA